MLNHDWTLYALGAGFSRQSVHCNTNLLYYYYYYIYLLCYLWCDVVWGAAEGACAHAFIHVLLTHAEVSDLDVALGVQHHVVELQIPAAERGREL